MSKRVREFVVERSVRADADTLLHAIDMRMCGVNTAVDDGDKTVLLVFGFIAIFVGAFTIYNTLSITVAQRARELATLRTIGASRRQVLGSVVTESAVVALVGAAVGTLVGFCARLWPAVAAVGARARPAANVEPAFATHTIVIAGLVGVIVTMLSGLIPALRATRVSPVSTSCMRARCLRRANDRARSRSRRSAHRPRSC